MIKKSELNAYGYARLSSSNIPLLLRGRYAQIHSVDKSSDDNDAPCEAQVRVVLYDASTTLAVLNTNMEPLTYSEKLFLRACSNGSRYSVLYDVSCQIRHLLNMIQDVLYRKLKIQSIDLWKIMDKAHFKQEILKALNCGNEENLTPDLIGQINFVMKRLERIEKYLDELTQLEDQIFRGHKPAKKPKRCKSVDTDVLSFDDSDSHIVNEIYEDGTKKMLVKITGSMEYVADFLELIKSKNENSLFEITQDK